MLARQPAPYCSWLVRQWRRLGSQTLMMRIWVDMTLFSFAAGAYHAHQSLAIDVVGQGQPKVSG
jgi:hypothetical protein